MKQPHEMRPGNRYARQAQARRTLGDLIANKSALVAICQGCKHRRRLFPAVLASHRGESFLVVDLAAAPALRRMQAPWHQPGLRVYALSHTETVSTDQGRKSQSRSNRYPKLGMFRASRALS
jgi:hypothetical protein